MSASERHLLNLIANGTLPAVAGKDMHWLLRYARRWGLPIDAQMMTAIKCV